MGKSKELAELGDVVTQSGGNVGIGTSSPVAKLQIRTQTDANAAFQNSTSVSGGVKINAFTDAANASVPFELDGSSLQFNTAAVERMRIDASGRVTMPYQPHISGTPNNSVGNGIADAFYTYNTPVGLSFSNSRITVPIGGNYMICWNTICDAGTGRVDTYIRVNGMQDVANGMGDSDHTDFRYRGISVVLRLAANDFIQFVHQDYYNPTMTSFDNWNHASVTFLG